ncbi:hypothetical protein M0805_009537 [Coniferiporia weirii]|nr:hypothetical protein M0805_009537 [Coniferiporia weirii]
MASHYDRPPVPYATRHSPIAGSSRGDLFYERDPRAAFPPQEAEYLENERFSPRRDDRAYYPPQEYIAPPREPRADPWGRDDPWYSRPTAYPRRPSPQPQPQQPAYPPPFQEFRAPPSPHWEEPPRWDPAPEGRGFEPSVAWRHTHREPPSSRLNSLLNPAPQSPEIDDRRWRESDQGPPVPRDYGRPYPPEHHAYDYCHPAYYDRPPHPEAELYRPHHAYDDRATHWGSSPYRPAPPPLPPPAPQRAVRPSAIRDYKRPRQAPFGQSPRQSDNGTPHWRDKGADSNRNSREGSLSSPAPVGQNDRERAAAGASQMGTRSTYFASTSASPAANLARPVWETFNDGADPVNDIHPRGLARSAQSSNVSPDNLAGPSEPLKQVVSAPSVINNQYGMTSASRSMSQGKPVSKVSNRHEIWDSSDESFPPGLNSVWNLSAPGEQAPISTPASNSRPSESSRRFSPVRHELLISRVDEISPLNVEDKQVSPAKEPSSVRAQLVASGRQGVMSVQNLVSPTPVKMFAPAVVPQKPPTPLLLDDNDMEIDEPPDQHLLSTQGSDPAQVQTSLATQARAAVKETAPERSVSFSMTSVQIASPSPPEELDRWAEPPVGPSVELPAAGISLTTTPSTRTPDLDAEGTLAEIEVQVAKATLSSPKPSPLPVVQVLQEAMHDGTVRVMPPRPKADEKDITDTLRKAIMVRRCLSSQTREQRINPILIDNLAKADEPVNRLSTLPETLIEEVLERVFSQSKEEHHMIARSVLAANFAGQREALAEKTQKLRNEYMMLHERWVAHCAQLDSLFKANDMQETAALTGRTTRRSAATLGDAVRSDLEMEQIIASLGNEDLTDPNHLAVRNIATIPDMISVERGHVENLFDDTNGLVDDPATFYDPRSGFYDWTPEEEAIFYEKYAEFPKQFGIISTFLPHKSSAQCVLYYYIHKKKLVDFRNAANSGNGKRRKGVRKSGKQKGNALLADVQQADSKRPAGRGRRRGRGGVPVDNGRGRGAGVIEPNVEQDPRPKRRRVTNTPRIILAKEMDLDDTLSVDTDQTREASVVPPKKRRGRKPKALAAAESPAATTVSGVETKFIDVNETAVRRKSTTTTSQWTETDRDDFIRLLSRHGKDFKRIASSMPNKTTIQVSNYYKSHLKEWGLDKVAAAATSRSPSPEQDRFVSVSRAEASQCQTPTEEVLTGALSKDADDRQVADATSGIGVLTLEQNGYAFTGAPPSFHALTQKSFVSVLNPGAFQTAGANRPHGVLAGLPLYPVSMGHPPSLLRSNSSPVPRHNSVPTGSITMPGPSRDGGVQEQTASQPLTHLPRYAFSPRMAMPIPAAGMRVMPYGVGGLYAPPREMLSQGSLRPGEYQSGLPLHMLPAGHPGLMYTNTPLGSPKPQPDRSKKPE